MKALIGVTFVVITLLATFTFFKYSRNSSFGPVVTIPSSPVGWVMCWRTEGEATKSEQALYSMNNQIAGENLAAFNAFGIKLADGTQVRPGRKVETGQKLLNLKASITEFLITSGDHSGSTCWKDSSTKIS